MKMDHGSRNVMKYRKKWNLQVCTGKEKYVHVYTHRTSYVYAESLTYFFLQLWLCNDLFFTAQLSFICEEKVQMFGLNGSLVSVRNCNTMESAAMPAEQ